MPNSFDLKSKKNPTQTIRRTKKKVFIQPELNTYQVGLKPKKIQPSGRFGFGPKKKKSMGIFWPDPNMTNAQIYHVRVFE